MEAAAEEVRWLGGFDYFVLNDHREDALQRISEIYRSTASGLGWSAYPPEAMEYHGSMEGLRHWAGRKTVVTAGPTREPLDDIRFLSNRSSGLMGCMLAAALRDAGADVTLVAGPISAQPPSGVSLVSAETAVDMGRILRSHMTGADFLAMAAAVSDYRPDERLFGKMDRSTGPTELGLVPNPDLLAGLGAGCPVLAFALELGEGAEERAVEKMRRKGADAVFLNRGDIEGLGMEHPGNAGVLLTRDGERFEVPAGSKRYVALMIADLMGGWLDSRDHG
jgi:phosphopantothenoylcysteine decarboxylase/phosphopantothenate--cysteine ligase